MPIATITALGPEEFCAGQSVTLQAPLGSNYSYVWYQDGEEMIGQTSRNLTASNSGIYTVKVRNNITGCENTSTGTEVRKGTLEFALFSYTGSTTFCDGGSLQLNAIAPPEGQTYTYRWIKDGQTIPGATGISYLAETSGAYQVEITETSIGTGCKKLSEPAVQVTVNPLPVADAGANQTLCATVGGPTVFTMAGSATHGTGVWSVVTGSQTGGATATITNPSSPSATVNVSGAGSVKVRYTVNSNTSPTCGSDFEEITLTVNPLPTAEAGVAQTKCATGNSTSFTLAGSVTNGTGVWSVVGNTGSAEVTSINPNALNSNVAISGVGTVTLRLTTTSNATNPNCGIVSDDVTLTVNPLPTADAGEDQTKCVTGSSTSFTLSGAVTNGTAAWTVVPNSQTGTAVATFANPSSPTSTVSITGTGSVRLRLTTTSNLTPACGIATDEVMLTVNPLPTAEAGIEQTKCATGNSTSFTLAGVVENGAGVWSVVGQSGTASATIANANALNSGVVVSGTGTVTLRLRAASNLEPACGTADDEVTLRVNPLPTADAGEDQAKCATGSSTSFTLSGSVTNGTGVWSIIGGNNIASLSSTTSLTPTVTVTSPGTVTLRLTSTSGFNPVCTAATDDVTLVVYTTPTASVTPASPAAVCGGSVTLTATSSPANASYTYQWYNQSGAISGATQSTYSASATGSYYVIITNPQGDGCSSAASSTVNVTVNPVPTVPINVTASSSAICGSGSVTLSATPGTNATTVRWYSASTGGTLLATNPSYSPTVSTTTTYYAASYNSTTGCENNTRVPVKVTVNPIPTVNAIDNRVYCNNASGAAINFGSSVSSSTYRWTSTADVGFGTSGTGNIGTYTATNAGTAAVTATVSVWAKANDCEGPVRTFTVSVNPTPVATFSGITDGQVVYSDGGNITLTPTGATGGTFSIVSPAGTSGLSTSGTLNPCTALGDATEKNITIRYFVSRTSNGIPCSNYEEKTVKLKRSIYTVIVLADPYPTCRGQITEYTAYVYKDATRVVYPYLADENGIAVDKNGNKLPDTTLPITNPDYPFPNKESMPKILYDNAWRYFQPVVEGGTLMPASNFNYSWTKNQQNFIGADKPTFQNAGLSSLDYYSVQVTSKNSACAQPISSKLGNRMYTSATVDYEVALTSDKTTICPGEGITMTADLNDAFAFWGDISLTLYWMLDRGGVISQLGETVYKSGDNIQFSTSGLNGVFQDGDKLFVEFSSALDQYNNANKCARGFITNVIPITVVGEQTINGGGAFCAGGAGIPVGINGSQLNVLYQLKRDGVAVGSPVTGTGNAISFGNQTVGGAYTVEAIARTGTDACLEFGPVNVNVTELPVVQNLAITDNGQYCAGGVGVAITLANSQDNVSYQLQRTYNNQTTSVGLARLGSDGQPIPFGNQTEPGVYSVLATTLPTAGTIAACPQTMGNVTVTVNPLPVAQTMTGGGSYCAESGGMPVGLQNSESGVTYRLLNSVGEEVSEVIGTGGAISFGDLTAGTYTVEAQNSTTSCSLDMPGSITVTEIALPTAFNMTGGGSFCADEGGAAIGLDGSQTGINYQLRRTVGTNTEDVGNPVAGTGSAISFGDQTESGTYSIVATTATTPSCPQEMGSMVVTINPMPLANRIFNNPSYCSLTSNGARVVIDNPEAGVTYELVGSDPLRSFSTDANGDLSIDEVPTGTYTIQGVNSATGCTTPSVGTVTVTDTRITDALGDMTYKWVGTDKWELTVDPATVIDDNGNSVSVPSNAIYTWYVTEPNATRRVYTQGPATTIVVQDLPQGTEIVTEVLPTNGICQLIVFVPNEIVPLPVELLYFNATKRGNDAVLDWATASEQDNLGFEVQVSSDAKNFRKLGFVKSRVGTTSLKQAYSFVDEENGKHGTRYYRLKQIDLDGKFEYFSIKAVQFGEVTMNKVKAYPNPFHSEVELSIDAELEGELQITVTTATGQQLLQRTVQVARGTNTEKLVLDPNLPRGVYIISTRMGDFNSHFKLLKQ
ncbi:T9SS type A sorting domain-containing protein [uncultured Pontibacter sp.]|uniref:Ig-like domain-containing protein n=1 Tax=uncultured Pontibacter sp. TaxID=453356 RepID=UPI002621D109|nr:T9SS type A sorting domain-containing protein [uncultured Pontibacter sp.]